MKTLTGILFFLTISFTSSLSAADFNELFDSELTQFNDIADRIATYHSENVALENTAKEQELLAMSTNLDAIIQTSETSPLYWFLKGLNEGNLASLYNTMARSAAAAEHAAARNSAYAMAMQLDRDHEPHLSAGIYATMKHGLPEELKIDAIQKELTLGGNGDDESYYWFLHWSNVNALQQAGRHAEAQQALDNMKNELAQRGKTAANYEMIAEQAEKQLAANNRPADKPQSTGTQEKQNDEENTISKGKITGLVWAVVIFAVISLLSLAIYELLIRRKK
jgi:hypothetical protein